MPSVPSISIRVAGLILVLCDAGASAGEPVEVPAYRGTVDVFTLTARGDIDGLVLTNGTEIKTPPRLSPAVARVVKQGDPVTVTGLKTASIPLVQAMSIRDDATGTTIILDRQGSRLPGPDALDTSDAPPRQQRIEGRIRLVLHGARGDADGALLDDGTAVRMSPPDAGRLAGILVAGHPLVVDGVVRVWTLGTTIEASAIGDADDRMIAVGPARDPAERRP